MTMIFDIGHVSLHVPDLDEAVRFASEFLGMHEVERVGDTAFLTLASPYPSVGAHCPHHVVEYTLAPEPALDHVGLVARDEAAVEEFIERAIDHGGVVLEGAPEPGIERGVRVAGPSGHVFEVYPGMKHQDIDYERRGVPPHRLGHVTFWSRDTPALVDFCTKALGFRISDWVGDPGKRSGCFMRCQFEHHQLAALTGPVDGIYHYAFEMGSVADISRLGDLLARRGMRFHWGPGRHGAGDNIAAYFAGPGGITIEAYADMQKIADPGWQPRVWSGDELAIALNLWGPAGDPAPMRNYVGTAASHSVR
jgi:catechol 2,3-dioxygenase-like lactoylglutathione lyase family enzyme